MKRILTAALGIALTGCVSNMVMKSYVGQPVEVAIMDYGRPVDILDLGDKMAYQWYQSRLRVSNYSGTAVTGRNVHCYYTLFVEDGIVTGYRNARLDC